MTNGCEPGTLCTLVMWAELHEKLPASLDKTPTLQRGDVVMVICEEERNTLFYYLVLTRSGIGWVKSIFLNRVSW